MSHGKRCTFFEQPSRCKYGQACKFLHQSDDKDCMPSRTVSICTVNATPAQKREFTQLKSDSVVGWLKRTFTLPKQHLKATLLEGSFEVTLAAGDAGNIVSSGNLRLDGIPVRVTMSKGNLRPQRAPNVSTNLSQKQAYKPRKEDAHRSLDASENVTKFWRRIQVAIEVDRKNSFSEQLKLHEPANRANWLGCWAVAAAGAPGSYEALLRILLNAPAKADIAPPAADVVQVLSRLVDSLSHSQKTMQSLTYLEMVVDTMETRLCGHESRVADIEIVLSYADVLHLKFMEKAKGVMNAVDPQGMMRVVKLMGRFSTIFPKYCDALQRAPNSTAHEAVVATNDTLPPWLAWLRPNIGWLMSDASDQSWLRTPGLSTNYEDTASYCETLQKLTTLLTFYWGAGAIAPRCRHQHPGAGEKSCAEPLLSPVRSSRICTQRLKNGESCKQRAVFSCPRLSHSDSVCSSCLKRLQLELMGRPQQRDSRCSTDIYDAVVEHEFTRREGQVLVLSKLESRKPPTVAPNWRTSYRLNVSALCAIGRLDMAHAPLQPSFAINWAEIVPISIGPRNDEGKNRMNCRMAVRLLGPSDCSALQGHVDLGVGTRVFVIDLRVFAPEVVPVLATYAAPAQADDFDQISFVNYLIGRAPRRPFQLGVTPATELRARITHALENSEMDVLFRLPKETRLRLTHKICDLAQQANLYGTQLEAFAEGLSCSVHCTLGPPGTGKSYTGVQMIAALDMIRDELLSAGIMVGPITLFSYKNHALDEMVKDVLAHPLLRNKVRQPGALIRCGKPDDPELRSFTEQRSLEEGLWEATLSERVQSLQLARQFNADLYDLADHLGVHSIAVQRDSNHADVALREWRPRTERVNAALVLAAAVNLLYKLEETLRVRQNKQGKNKTNEPEDQRDYPTPHAIVQDSKEAYEALKMTDCSKYSYRQHQDASVQGLSAGAEHWPDKMLNVTIRNGRSPGDRTFAILQAWLSGLEPPPRCQAAEEDAEASNAAEKRYLCLGIVSQKGAYCKFHGCCHPTGCARRRTTFDAHVPYCEEHRCTANVVEDVCANPRVPGGSCCINHSCRACVHFHAVLGTPVHKAAPFACMDHQCQTMGCNRLILNPFVSFCRQHCCPACLHERSTSVKPVLPGGRWCTQHACTVDGCQHICLTSTENVLQTLCEAHACVACVGQRRLIDPIFPASKLCDQHRCQYISIDPIDDQQLLCCIARTAGSTFCQYHSCRVCCLLHQSSPAHRILPTVDAFPRNVCSLHPLCSFVSSGSKQCEELAESSGFCGAHQRAASARQDDGTLIHHTCHGKTAKGKPCKAKGKAPPSHVFYCNAHLDQAPANSSSDDSSSEESSAEEFENVKAHEIEEDGFMPMDQDGFSRSDGKQAQSRSPHHLLRPSQLPAQLTLPPPSPHLDLPQAHPSLSLPSSPSPLPPSPPPPLSKLPPQALAVQPAKAGKLPLVDRLAAEDTSDDDELANAIAESRNLVRDVSSCSVCSVSGGDGGAGASSATANIDPGVESDMDNAREPLTFNIDPDEVDFEEDLQGLNDEQIRLQQILGDDLYVADEGELDVVEGDIEHSSGAVDAEEADLENLLSGVRTWAWQIPVDERWAKATAFLRGAAGILTELRSLAQPHIDEARQGRAEASADAFKKARLVAATVVGGVRRLQPLRAAEPFAAVVEEACEVMEPTLMAVLSVRSLRKLELVGDHRQLPAAVPPAWFNLEAAIPSIKVSLFERLVTGAAGRGARSQNGLEGGVAPCTVLDEQRRMRPAISDLTRGHYSDLVHIQDHSCTVAQRIGDRCKGAVKDTLQLERAAWASRGELVPGVAATEYFWDLPNNEQGRPVAGLSACNYKEAEAVASLVRHLTLNGVPHETISIITPYKGQKGAIQKALQKAGVIKPPKRSDRGHIEFDDSMVVSTVDRFQGDENDIIILSLVRTTPGNRFVALHNRFIVATSRARIGFYTIGTVDAVTKSSSGSKGPEHWCRLVDHLKEGRVSSTSASSSVPPTLGNATAGIFANRPPLEDDSEKPESNKAAVMCAPCDGDREKPKRPGSCGVGRTFPICCPRHPQTVLEINCGCMDSKCKKTHFPSGSISFCAQRCSKVLKWCGHTCAVPCHPAVRVQHTKPEACQEPLQRPCIEHQNVLLTCGMLFKAYHQFKASMAETLSSAYECDVPVEYHRIECPHSVKLNCSTQREVLSGKKKLEPCTVQVDDWIHPACNHVFKAPKCHERQGWQAAPPRCQTVVTHVKPCGCTDRLRCFELSDTATSLTPCTVGVNMHRPRCSHQLSVRCYERAALLELWDATQGVSAIEDRAVGSSPHTVRVHHGEAYGPAESQLHDASEIAMNTVKFKTVIPECMVPVDYVGACGHTTSHIQCARAFCWADPANPLAPPPCKKLVSARSMLCGHEVEIECALATSDAWLNCAAVNSSAALPEGLLEELPQFSPAMEKAIATICNKTTDVLRHCGHITPVPCKRLLAMLRTKKFPKCKEAVSRKLEECGHEVMVACSAQEDAAPECHEVVHTPFVFHCGKHKAHPGTCHKLRRMLMDQPPCQEKVQCTLFRCGHTTTVACRFENAVTAAQPGKRIEQSNMIVAGGDYCLPCPDAPLCEVGTIFRNTCGHEFPAACHLAFGWAASPEDAPPCEAVVQLDSPLCGHSLEIKCHQSGVLCDLDLWGDATPWSPTLTGSHDGGATTVEMIVVEHGAPRPQLDTLTVAQRELLSCGGKSMVQRECGHTEMVPCIDALRVLETGRCLSPVDLVLPCDHVTTLTCHQAGLVERNDVKHWCDEQVEKTCSRCCLNSCIVPCSQRDVLCNRDAAAALPCGHEVHWGCGDDPDPRTDRTKACATCVLQQWEAAAVAPIEEKQWTMQLRSFAAEKIPDAIEVQELEVNFDGLVKAQKQVLAIGCDLLQSKVTNDELWPMERAAPPLLSDMGCFDIVFCPMKDTVLDEERINQRYSQQNTEYGLGTHMLLLTLENLKNCSNSEEVTMRICVGAAFRFAGLEEVKPFRNMKTTVVQKRRGTKHDKYEKNKGPKKHKKPQATSDAEQIQRANHLRKMHLCQGKDFVVPCQPCNPLSQSRVYWVQGSVLPLCIAKIRLFNKCGVCDKGILYTEGGPATGFEFLCSSCRLDCCICFEAHASSAGLACESSSAHFMCDECLDAHVRHASSFDALEAFRRNDGIKCPVPGCSAPRFEESALAQRLRKAAFDGFTQAKVKIQEQQIVAEVEARVAAEAAAKQIADVERFQRKQHIIEKILTSACPRCGQAFVDFTGCMALTCVRPGCSCAFCALCQKDCGRDAHQHVPTCPDNPLRSHFASDEQYQNLLRTRITKVLRDYLHKLTGEQKQHALEVHIVVPLLPSLSHALLSRTLAGLSIRASCSWT